MTRSTDPLRYFKSSPEVIRPVVMMSVHYPLSLRNVTGSLSIVRRRPKGDRSVFEINALR